MIRLTGYDSRGGGYSRSVYINPIGITYITANDEYTTIHYDEGRYILVTEAAEDVVNLINKSSVNPIVSEGS